MKLIESLLSLSHQLLMENAKFESLADQLAYEFQEAFPENKKAVTYLWISGNLEPRRINRVMFSGSNSEDDEKIRFMREFAVRNGILKQTGKRYDSTELGAAFKQFLSQNVHNESDLRQAVRGGAKELSKFGREVGAKATDDFMSRTSDTEKNMIAILQDMDITTLKYLLGLATKQKNKEQYLSYIETSMEKDRDKIEYLQHLGFLKQDFTLNVPMFKSFREYIKSLDPAQRMALFSELKQKGIRTSGDEARLRNQFVNIIHPLGFSQTPTGARLWDMLNSMPDNAYQSYKKFLSRKANLTDTRVAQSYRSKLDPEMAEILDIIVKNYDSKETAVNRITDMAEKRRDFKSLDRKKEKTAGRRSAIEDQL